MFKHRIFILLLASLLSSAFLVSSAIAQRGIVPVPIKDKSGNQVLLYQESHALLIGVSEYTGGWSNLPGVRKDLDEVKNALEEKGFHAVMVINPTRVELRDSIENFINQYGQDIDNRLIFYFAGHGHTMQSSYGEEMGYFVPADAPNPNTDKSGFLATSINMESIEVYSKQVQSKHALFLFDSCFSGSIFSLSRAIPENISYKTSKPVRQFITAGSADETVPDESIFNDQLIRALNGEGDLDGDGYLTGVELGEFLNKTVINYSKGSQHPQYGKIRNPNLDKGDFVFSLFDRKHIEQSIDSIVQEREKLEQKRFNLEEERKRTTALQRMQEEERKLKEEKRRLKEERDRLASVPPPTQPKAKSSGQCPDKMSFISGGVFMAGLAEGSGSPVREMSINAFCMDQYEVTQAEYKRVMGNNPSYFVRGNHPVENMTWQEAKAYCEKEDKHLPTEWEWEKAAKAGTTTLFYWGNDEPSFAYAWYGEDYGRTHHPVGHKKPNTFILYDMSGNVAEWTDSDYDYHSKVLRGGSLYSSEYGVGSAHRNGADPARSFTNYGFRCAYSVGNQNTEKTEPGFFQSLFQ